MLLFVKELCRSKVVPSPKQRRLPFKKQGCGLCRICHKNVTVSIDRILDWATKFFPLNTLFVCRCFTKLHPAKQSCEKDHLLVSKPSLLFSSEFWWFSAIGLQKEDSLLSPFFVLYFWHLRAFRQFQIKKYKTFRFSLMSISIQTLLSFRYFFWQFALISVEAWQQFSNVIRHS